MSAPENLDTRARLLMYARWATIGLAALFGLIFAVFGGAASLRLAASMAVLAVVVVLISITINGPQSTKVHLEETLLDEIDMLRDDVRADITTAARATHRALAEKVAHLHGDLEHMRRTLDGRPLGAAPASGSAVGSPVQRRAIGPAGPVVHHTETVHVTTHQTYVDPTDDDASDRYAPRPAARRPERDERADYDRGRAADYERGRSAEPDRGRADERWDPPREHRPAAAPHDDWSERSRARTPMPADPYEDSGEIPARRGSRSRDDDPADDPRWSGMRSGDRWAEVRADERGRELRMGERRKTIRADETGTQMRIVDRWSSVREPAGYEPGAYGSPAQYGRYDEAPAARQEDASRYGRYDEAPSGGFRTGADNTGETRSERRRREEAEASAREADPRRSSRRAEPEAGRWAPEPRSDRARPALPSSGPESAAGWMGREEQEVDWRGRSRQEISGEIVRPSRSVPQDTEQPWSAPRRPDPRVSEPRVSDPRMPDPRMSDPRVSEQRGSQPRGSQPRVSEPRTPERSRADDRWEREPSGGRQPVRPRLDFDGSDDRWH
ncbi:MAG TPA: hypothetical protein VGJ28_07660 [Micromonosporaceae bacterium]|jgi:hypothetical protein